MRVFLVSVAAALTAPSALLAADAAKETPQARLLAELKDQGHILFEKYCDSRCWDVCIMRADGSEVRHLTNTGDLHEHLPCAPPGGGRVFYVRTPSIILRGRLWPFKLYAHLPWEWEGHLWQTDETGARHEPVTFRQAGRRVPVTEASGLAAPDPDTIIYGDAWNQRIAVLHLPTGRRRLYPVTGSPRHLALAPDGHQVWYAAPGEAWRLYRLDLRTGDVRAIAGEGFLWPAVSHDGSRLVHAVEGRPDADGGIAERSLVIRDLDATGGTRLLFAEKGTQFACPAWGPGDRYLAYCRRKGNGTWGMWVVRLSDMVSVRIAPGHRINPHWILPRIPTTRPTARTGTDNEPRMNANARK